MRQAHMKVLLGPKYKRIPDSLMSDLYFLSHFVKKLHHVYGMIVNYLQIHIRIYTYIHTRMHIHAHTYTYTIVNYLQIHIHTDTYTWCRWFFDAGFILFKFFVKQTTQCLWKNDSLLSSNTYTQTNTMILCRYVSAQLCLYIRRKVHENSPSWTGAVSEVCVSLELLTGYVGDWSC